MYCYMYILYCTIVCVCVFYWILIFKFILTTIQYFDVLLCILTHYNLLSVFLILISISAFVENSLTNTTEELMDVLESSTLKVSDEFTWNIPIKTTDAYPFCESLADRVQYEQINMCFYRSTRENIFICAIAVCYCYTKVHEWKATPGSIPTAAKIACSDLPIHWTNLCQPLSRTNPSYCQIQST